nr:methyltransferase domain-containing protein [Candidatus Baldrarchaeota archaeon]
MADFQAKMFNKKASDPKNKPDQIIEAIVLRPGQSIADIGLGGGYFSLRFAKIVGEERRVYAVDTKPEFLEYVKNSAKEKGLNNIPTLVSGDKLNLSEKSLDLIFMRNVTHIPNRVEYFKNLKRFLKPGGRIAIIEYKKGKISLSVDCLDTTFIRKLSFKRWKRQVICWKRNPIFYQNNILQFMQRKMRSKTITTTILAMCYFLYCDCFGVTRRR